MAARGLVNGGGPFRRNGRDLVFRCFLFTFYSWIISIFQEYGQELHEYEADEAVLKAGTDIKEYQYLLIKKAVSKSGYSVANSRKVAAMPVQ